MNLYGRELLIIGIIITAASIIGIGIIIVTAIITSSNLKKQLEKEYGEKP